jgi:hypothetical protein
MDKILKLNVVFYILSVFVNKYFLQNFYSTNFTFFQTFLIIGYLYLSIIIPYIIYVYYRNSELKIEVLNLFSNYKISSYEEEIQNGLFDRERFNYEGISKKFESIVLKYREGLWLSIFLGIMILGGLIMPSTLHFFEKDYYWIMVYNIIPLATILINTLSYFFNYLIEESYYSNWALKSYFKNSEYKLIWKRNPFRYSYILLGVNLIIFIFYYYNTYIR